MVVSYSIALCGNILAVVSYLDHQINYSEVLEYSQYFDQESLQS